MPEFAMSAVCRAPVEEVWKLLFDPARFPEWWVGIETVHQDAPGDFTLWLTGYPDFPVPQKLRVAAGRPGLRARHDLLPGLRHRHCLAARRGGHWRRPRKSSPLIREPALTSMAITCPSSRSSTRSTSSPASVRKCPAVTGASDQLACLRTSRRRRFRGGIRIR